MESEVAKFKALYWHLLEKQRKVTKKSGKTVDAINEIQTGHTRMSELLPLE
jgi:hypothetical protein